jgi:hypothetical protein
MAWRDLLDHSFSRAQFSIGETSSRRDAPLPPSHKAMLPLCPILPIQTYPRFTSGQIEVLGGDIQVSFFVDSQRYIQKVWK